MIGLLLLGSALAAETVLQIDLSESDGGLVAGGDPLQWEWGTVDPDVGPRGGWLGAAAWGTRLDGPYMHEADDWLRLPPRDLTGLSEPHLGLTHWYQIQADGDLARIEVQSDGAWAPLEPVYGYPWPGGWAGDSGGWQTAWVDLAGIQDLSQVRLAFTSTPALAQDGWYLGAIEIVDGDPVPPRVELLQVPRDTTQVERAHAVRARIDDDRGVLGAELRWVAGGADAGSAPLLEDAEGWTGQIPPMAPGTSVVWWVSATDGENTGIAEGDPFRVYLPAPFGLEGPTGRVVGTSAELRWQPPLSRYPITAYEVWREGIRIITVTPRAGGTPEPHAEVPLEGPVDHLEVRAVFSTPTGLWTGDPSAPLAIEASVPAVTELAPSAAWPGDRLRIDLRGETLLLQAGDTTVDLGEGVEVLSIDVIDANSLQAVIQVAEDARPGPRALRLQSGPVALDVPGRFEVEDGADRPRVLALSPARLEQGGSRRVEISINVDLQEAPIVELGDDLIVTGVRLRGPRAIEASVTAPPGAGTGPREVLVDDGARLLRGARLTVVPPAAPPARVCGAAGAPAPALLPLLAAGMLLWRRSSRGRRRAG